MAVDPHPESHWHQNANTSRLSTRVPYVYHIHVITIPSAPLYRGAQHKLSVRTNMHEGVNVENCKKNGIRKIEMCRIKVNCYLQPVTKLPTRQQSNSNHKLYNICEVHNYDTRSAAIRD